MSFKRFREYRQGGNIPIVILIVSSGGPRGGAGGARTPTSFRPNFFGGRPQFILWSFELSTSQV